LFALFAWFAANMDWPQTFFSRELRELRELREPREQKQNRARMERSGTAVKQ
jgi:hypothetical protein